MDSAIRIIQILFLTFGSFSTLALLVLIGYEIYLHGVRKSCNAFNFYSCVSVTGSIMLSFSGSDSIVNGSNAANIFFANFGSLLIEMGYLFYVILRMEALINNELQKSIVMWTTRLNIFLLTLNVFLTAQVVFPILAIISNLLNLVSGILMALLDGYFSFVFIRHYLSRSKLKFNRNLRMDIIAKFLS